VKPDFDELIDDDVRGAERERLERVHELLVAAGPPAELPPHLEQPSLAMTLARRPGRNRRRVAAIAAIAAVLAIAFVVGYIAGNRGGGLAAQTSLQLTGTKAAPNALASLRILPVDSSGNWPMRLSATGLPKLGKKWYYEVFLVRSGKIYAPCGSFVSTGTVDVSLNAPYRLQPHDTWVVTKQHQGDRARGPVVLRPLT
jgi:Anti-sigma-K factor rskA